MIALIVPTQYMKVTILLSIDAINSIMSFFIVITTDSYNFQKNVRYEMQKKQ